jgi:membrane protein DedA with SNARE-associated domain
MALLERYGGPAVFLGRFVAFARALIPGLAGMSGLRYRTFLFYNAAGGIIWGVGYTLLGFVVGLSFEHILSVVGRWSILVVAVLLIGITVVHVIRKRRAPKRPAAGPAASAGDGAGGPTPGSAAHPGGSVGEDAGPR